MRIWPGPMSSASSSTIKVRADDWRGGNGSASGEAAAGEGSAGPGVTAGIAARCTNGYVVLEAGAADPRVARSAGRIDNAGLWRVVEYRCRPAASLLHSSHEPRDPDLPPQAHFRCTTPAGALPRTSTDADCRTVLARSIIDPSSFSASRFWTLPRVWRNDLFVVESRILLEKAVVLL